MSAKPMSMKVATRYAIAALRDYRQFGSRQLERDCPICGFHGIFVAAARPPRWNSRCPSCDSRERHRLAHLLYQKLGIGPGQKLSVLHFAPEVFMIERMKDDPGYVTSDPKMAYAKLNEDIQAISLGDETFDLVIAHHVLEHVPDDAKAFSEIRRVLKPGGRAILSVPQNWARETTVQEPSITGRRERAAAYGAIDHLRYYGRDFADKLRLAGFAVETYRPEPLDEMRMSLGFDDAIHIATKPA